MRYPPNHRAASRARILAAAAALLRRVGLAGTTIDDLMAGAGLTRGSFYAHFGDKDAALAAAAEQSLREVRAALGEGLAGGDDSAWLYGATARYLGRHHRDQPEGGCPLPAIAAEASRGQSSLRRTLADGIGTYQSAIVAHLGGVAAAERGERALGILALYVGGLLLARLVPDAARSDEVLRACRHAAQQLADVP
ncbi:MAG: TetR/AcrR family transcriptional regulator [Alphaproteobacteria bacterium]|nr:TetR/AcrR family transcriptional regulator [Alphaproteobacteria bacterium]